MRDNEKEGIEKRSFSEIEPEEVKSEARNIDFIMDITLDVRVILGKTRMSIGELLKIGEGSIIELDRIAGEAVDVLVNDKLVAKGEVVVIDERLGVKITEVISPAERVKSLK